MLSAFFVRDFPLFTVKTVMIDKTAKTVMSKKGRASLLSCLVLSSLALSCLLT